MTVRSPRAVAHALYRPGQLGHRPGLRVRRARGRRPRQHDRAAADAGSRRRWIAPPRRRLALAAARAMGLERPPAAPAVRARARGPPALDRPRPPLGAPPLRPAGRVLRALPRRLDDLQLRDLLARGRDARGGPGDQARARVHQARPARPASACSTSAAAGAASRSTRPSTTASTSPASRCRRRRPSAPAPAPRRPASPTASTSASRTGASCSGSASTRSPRSGWSSTSATTRSTPTRCACASCWSPTGGCSTTASRACATATPRPGRSPSATSSPTPRRCTSGA